MDTDTVSPAADPDRFATALESCRRALLAVAQAEMPGHLSAKGGASDLVQNTLAAAYRHRDQFRGHSLADLRAWLRGILGHELVNFYRQFRTARRDIGRELAGTPTDVPAGAAGPLHDLVKAERAAAVTASVARLPAEARRVLVLRLEMRLGFREIGDRTGRTEEAARKVFTRAVEQLRQANPDAA